MIRSDQQRLSKRTIKSGKSGATMAGERLAREQNAQPPIAVEAVDVGSPLRRGGDRPGVRFTSNVVGSLHFAADIISFTLSVPTALVAYSVIRGARIIPDVHLFAFVLTLASFLLVRSSRQVYRRSILDPAESFGDVAFDAVLSSLIASALVWQAGLIEDYSRGLTLLFLICVVGFLWASRLPLRLLVSALSGRGHIEQRIAFYGADPRAIALTRRLIDSLSFDHVRFVGVADDRVLAKDIHDLPFIGGLEQLCELARLGEVDQVLINGSQIGHERTSELVEQLSSVCVDVSLIPADAIELAPNYQVNLLGTTPVLTLWQRPFRDINQIVKRGEDLILASLAVIALAPILGLTAILVRLSSPGSVLFVQPRIGFNNEVIHVFKFRTMYVHLTDMGAAKTTTRDDPRVTPVGRLLRKFSIDELPQLLNVLQGSMSLVGPRPHALEMKVGDLYYHEAVRGYAGRHRVRPGITGLAQVKGLRGEVRTVERAKRRVELDKEYVDRWSLWLDLKILVLTARAVLFDNDAY